MIDDRCSTKIIKAFVKTFPTKMKPKQCPAKFKKWSTKDKKRREERKWQVKVKTAVSRLNPKTSLKFCFLHMPDLHKLVCCIWIRRLQSVQPVNGFLVSFSSYYCDSDQKTAWLASKCIFQQNLQGRIGLKDMACHKRSGKRSQKKCKEHRHQLQIQT